MAFLFSTRARSSEASVAASFFGGSPRRTASARSSAAAFAAARRARTASVAESLALTWHREHSFVRAAASFLPFGTPFDATSRRAKHVSHGSTNTQGRAASASRAACFFFSARRSASATAFSKTRAPFSESTMLASMASSAARVSFMRRSFASFLRNLSARGVVSERAGWRGDDDGGRKRCRSEAGGTRSRGRTFP